MFEIVICNKREDFPEWLQDTTNWFYDNKMKQVGVFISVKECSVKYWKAIGRVLLDNLIFKKEFSWIYLETTFSPDIIMTLTRCMNSQVEQGEISCFNYKMFHHPHPWLKGQTIYENEWLSFSKTNIYPFDRRLFDFFPNIKHYEDDILIASPNVLFDKMFKKIDFQSDVILNPKLEFISQYIGNWLYPLDNYHGYFIGSTEGEPFFEEIQKKQWFLEQMEKEFEFL